MPQNIKLTEEQSGILRHTNENIYVSAAPGSGKSTLLSLLADKILLDNNTRILLITFTNKAAKSIKEKCSSSDQSRIIGGTFHSIAYRLMKQNGLNVTICDENKKRVIIKKLFGCRKEKDKFEKIYDSISNAKSKFPMEQTNEVRRYNEELKKYGLLDFDDIIYRFIILSNEGKKFGIPTITHCLVDELQDTSGPQLEMLRTIKRRANCKMVGVADDDQCYKFGSKTTIIDEYGNNKLVNIEDVKIGNMIKSHKNGSLCYLPVSNRNTNYKKCIEIKTETKVLSTTLEHKWFVKKPNKNINICYLMWKKDYGFRIGTSNYLSIVERMRSEKSHKVWILSEHASKYDAEINEKLLSLKYKVPVQTFIKHNYDQYDYKPVFDMYGNNGYEVLRDNNLRFDYPFQIASSSRRDGVINITITLDGKGGSNYIRFESYELDEIKLKSINLNKKSATTGRILISSFKETIKKCKEICEELNSLGFETNVIQKLNHNNNKYDVLTANQVKIGSKVLIEIDGELIEEEVISIRKEEHCRVVDLEVEQSGRLIVNEILSHNSIYAWRGARPENVRDFISEFGCLTLNMGTNFRSTTKIVKHSKELIECNHDRLPKSIRAATNEKGLIKQFKCANPFDEIDYIKELCERNEGQEISILYRNRTFKNHLEFELRKAGYAYRLNDFLDITDRSAVRVLISCLKIAANDFDIFDLEQASKALKGIGTVTVRQLQNASVGKKLPDVVREWKRDEKLRKKVFSLARLQKFFKDYPNGPLDELVRFAEKLFIKSFDYQDDMKLFLLDITKEFKINAPNIKELANELGLSGTQDGNNDDSDALIELSTVHGYKGLERDIVILPFCQTYLEVKPGRRINIEEERRLFYVAATRAKKKLYMCYSGSTPRFITEMGL